MNVACSPYDPVVPDNDENTPQRITMRDGATTIGWAPDGAGLSLITPDGREEAIAFSSQAMFGGWDLVVSDDERYLAVFVYSGQSSQGYELFQIRPAFAHIGSFPETVGHGSSPMFSPDSRWLVMFMDDEFIVRETGEYFEEVADEASPDIAVVDWARLHAQRLPDLDIHSVAVGVEIPLSTDPDTVFEWRPYDMVRFASPDVVVLTMPWGEEISVPLPADAAVTCRGFAPNRTTDAM